MVLRAALEYYTGIWFPGAWVAAEHNSTLAGPAHPAPVQHAPGTEVSGSPVPVLVPRGDDLVGQSRGRG
ncbi:hypothetical protein GCM10010400_38390 [Streptomyces aculeolatus]